MMRPIKQPVTVDPGTTYGASFDLNPPLARNTTKPNANPYSNPKPAPAYQELWDDNENPVSSATNVLLIIEANIISSL